MANKTLDKAVQRLTRLEDFVSGPKFSRVINNCLITDQALVSHFDSNYDGYLNHSIEEVTKHYSWLRNHFVENGVENGIDALPNIICRGISYFKSVLANEREKVVSRIRSNRYEKLVEALQDFNNDYSDLRFIPSSYFEDPMNEYRPHIKLWTYSLLKGIEQTGKLKS